MPKANQVDRALKKQGFGGIDDPTLMKQLAFMVRDHDHFRSILVSVQPEKRMECYESLRPEIKRFIPKPLDVYLSEAADLAARKEQGAQYDVTDLDRVAQDAIRKDEAIKQKKGLMKLTCQTCERSESYMGVNPQEAFGVARRDGWRLITHMLEERFLCPQCSIASVA